MLCRTPFMISPFIEKIKAVATIPFIVVLALWQQLIGIQVCVVPSVIVTHYIITNLSDWSMGVGYI